MAGVVVEELLDPPGGSPVSDGCDERNVPVGGVLPPVGRRGGPGKLEKVGLALLALLILASAVGARVQLHRGELVGSDGVAHDWLLGEGRPGRLVHEQFKERPPSA